MIRRVDERGVPVSPEKAESGYNNAIGVIVRETVNIICKDLRAKEQAAIRGALLEKLLNRYVFQIYGEDENCNGEIMKRVTLKALSMM